MLLVEMGVSKPRLAVFTIPSYYHINYLFYLLNFFSPIWWSVIIRTTVRVLLIHRPTPQNEPKEQYCYYCKYYPHLRSPLFSMISSRTVTIRFMLILLLLSNSAIYTTANPCSTSARVPIITLRNSLAAMTIKFRFHIRIRII